MRKATTSIVCLSSIAPLFAFMSQVFFLLMEKPRSRLLTGEPGAAIAFCNAATIAPLVLVPVMLVLLPLALELRLLLLALLAEVDRRRVSRRMSSRLTLAAEKGVSSSSRISTNFEPEPENVILSSICR